jgi:hypothetical protein
MMDPLLKKDLVRMRLDDLFNESEKERWLKKVNYGQHRAKENLVLRLWASLLSFGL